MKEQLKATIAQRALNMGLVFKLDDIKVAETNGYLVVFLSRYERCAEIDDVEGIVLGEPDYTGNNYTYNIYVDLNYTLDGFLEFKTCYSNIPTYRYKVGLRIRNPELVLIVSLDGTILDNAYFTLRSLLEAEANKPGECWQMESEIL